jgi:hypothetical protein
MNDKIATFEECVQSHQLTKLKSLIVDSLNADSSLLNAFEGYVECKLFGTSFTTSVLYYFFAMDEYELAKYLLLKGFNVYKGKP